MSSSLLIVEKSLIGSMELGPYNIFGPNPFLAWYILIIVIGLLQVYRFHPVIIISNHRDCRIIQVNFSFKSLESNKENLLIDLIVKSKRKQVTTIVNSERGMTRVMIRILHFMKTLPNSCSVIKLI